MSDQQRIGRYRIISELGRGGMATVYLAEDDHFQRQVAVKILPKQFLDSQVSLERFTSEAQTIASLEHYAIVPVYDFGTHEDQPYLVMRLMTGGSLEQRLENSSLSPLEVDLIFARISDALSKAHGEGIVHRDIKPANILFDDEGAAYLSDFGIAVMADHIQGGTMIGTPQYMAPEQAQGEDTSVRTDVYQCGVMLFELLTGQPPFSGKTAAALLFQHVYGETPSVLDIDPDLPAAVDAVVKRAMAKEPRERFASTAQLSTAFSTAVQETVIEGLPPPLGSANGASSQTAIQKMIGGKRWAWPIAAIVLLFLAWFALQLIQGNTFMTSSGIASAPGDNVNSTAAQEDSQSPQEVPSIDDGNTAASDGEPSAVVSPVESLEVESIAVPATDIPQPEPTATPAATATPPPKVISVDNIDQVDELTSFNIGDDDGISWLPDNQHIVLYGNSLALKVWDTAAGEQVESTEDLSKYYDEASEPRVDSIIVEGFSQNIPGTDEYENVLQGIDQDNGSVLFEYKQERTVDVTWAQDRDYLAIGLQNGMVDVRDGLTGDIWFSSVPTSEAPVSDLTFSPEGLMLAVSREGYRIFDIYDVFARAKIHTLDNASSVSSMSWSPDGNMLATLSLYGVRLWDPELEEELIFADASGWNHRWSPDSTKLILITRTDVRILDGSSRQETVLSDNDASRLTLSPDKSIISVIETDINDQTRIRFWIMQDGSPLHEFGGERGEELIDFSWSQDGTKIATLAEDGTVRIWGFEPET